MYYIITVILIIGYSSVSALGIYTLYFMIKNRGEIRLSIMGILSIITLANAIFIYSPLFLLSILFYYSETANLLLWKATIILGFLSIIVTSLIYSFILEYKKAPFLPFFYFTVLSGLIIGQLFSPSAIGLVKATSISEGDFIWDISQINYTYEIITGILIILLQTSLVVFLIILSLLIHKHSRNKETTRYLIANSFIFSIPIFFYMFYVFIPLSFLRDFHLILLWLNIIGVSITLIRRPHLFLVLTNKIYYVNIYHKSGVLLYSYKFEETENEADSAIWGNILIGLNHILSEFINKKDQIDVLQTKKSEIVVNYDDLGFAVVVITNQKNEILENLMKQFKHRFKKRYRGELEEIQDLNKLINVSEFQETKEIIEESFEMYL